MAAAGGSGIFSLPNGTRGRAPPFNVIGPRPQQWVKKASATSDGEADPGGHQVLSDADRKDSVYHSALFQIVGWSSLIHESNVYVRITENRVGAGGETCQKELRLIYGRSLS